MEIAKHAPRLRIELLGKQADIVAQREKPFEQRFGLLRAPAHDVGIRQPKAAREARSNATHAMIFEYVKCSGGPRTSHIP